MTEERLLEALGLKALDRAGWVRKGIEAPESVAAHSWGVAWLVLVLLPAELDRERALVYAVLHDLAEVRTGDLLPGQVPRPEKNRREQAAMAELCEERPDLQAAWEAYEAQADPESRFVREPDRLDMALQAVAYQRRTGTDLTEFLDSAAQAIEHPDLIPLLTRLREEG